MAAYYSPSVSAGSQWQHQSSSNWRSGIAQQHTPHSRTREQYANGPENQPQQLQMVMQQLQQYSHAPNASQQQSYAVATPAQPVMEPRKLPAPTSQDNALLAQIIHEQTKRGLNYKAALESLHGHNGIMAYAWKDYYLENKEVIDEVVFSLRGMPPPPYFKSQMPSPPTTDTPIIPEKPLAQADVKPKPSADDEGTKRKPPRAPRPSLSRTPSESRATKLNTDVKHDGKSKHNTPLSATKPRGRQSRVELSRRSNDRSSGTPSSSKVRDAIADKAPRRTHNSLSSAPSSDLLNDVPPAVAIDPQTGLPAAPSRSPSPPPVRESNSRMTEAETIFFYRRIAYDLKRDPDLTKLALCDILAKIAPQRSALSWKTVWAKHEKVADKMYLLTELCDNEDRQAAIRSWKGTESTLPTMLPSRRSTNGATYKETTTDDEDNSDSDTSGSSRKTDDSSSDDELSSLGETEDELLGESGSPFKAIEHRVIAKYINTRQNWYKGRRDWSDFQTLFPETKTRTISCWKEFYRRKQHDIDRLAKKYSKKAKEDASLSAQRGRPSWANSGNVKKRRLSGFPGGSNISEGKRAKVEDDE